MEPKADMVLTSFHLQRRLLNRLWTEFLLWSPLWTTTSDMDCNVLHYHRRYPADFIILSRAADDWENYYWHGRWNRHFNCTNLVCFPFSLVNFRAHRYEANL